MFFPMGSLPPPSAPSKQAAGSVDLPMASSLPQSVGPDQDMAAFPRKGRFPEWAEGISFRKPIIRFGGEKPSLSARFR